MAPTAQTLDRLALGARVEPDVRDQTSAIAAGDTEAFARFFRQRFDAMYAEAFRASRRDEAFCLDVVQDAMMRVIRSLRPMDTEDHLRRWLRAVVQSCVYDRLRRESRRRRRERGRPRDGAGAAGRDDLQPRLRWLEQQLRELDDESASLLIMRHRFGWTLRQIGEALGVGPGAVDGRLRRLVRRLRRRAREDFDE